MREPMSDSTMTKKKKKKVKTCHTVEALNEKGQERQQHRNNNDVLESQTH